MSKELFQSQIDEAKKHVEAQARQLAEFMQPITDHAIYEVFNAQFNLLNQAIENLRTIILLEEDGDGIETTENPCQAQITEAHAFNTATFIAEHPLVPVEATINDIAVELNQEYIVPAVDPNSIADDQAPQPAPTAIGSFFSRIFSFTSSNSATNHAHALQNLEDSHNEGEPRILDDNYSTQGNIEEVISPVLTTTLTPIVAEQNTGSFFSSIFSCGGCSGSAVVSNAHAPQDFLDGQHKAGEELKVSDDDTSAQGNTEAAPEVIIQNATDERTIIDPITIIGYGQLPSVLTLQPVASINLNTTINVTHQQQVDQYGLPIPGQLQGQSLSTAEIGSSVTSTDSVVLKLYDNNNHDHDHDQIM